MDTNTLCPCCSGDPYEKCCKPLHDGLPPKNALQLMRSRYAAYALNLPHYIMITTHPKSPHFSTQRFSWKREISTFCRSTTFHELEILNFQDSGIRATVTFTAHLSQGKTDCSFTEASEFELIEDRWYYLKGQHS